MSQFLEDDKVKTNTTYSELLKRIWPYIRLNIGLFSVVVFAIVSLAVISRALPFLIGYAVDQGFKNKNAQLLSTIAFLYLTIEILKMGLSFLHKYLFQLLGTRVLGQMRQDLVEHVQKLPINYFQKNPAGRTVTRLTNDIAVLSEVFSDGVVSLLMQAAIIISIILAMSLVSIKLTILTLISTPLFVYAAYWLSEKVKIILREQKKKLSEINSYVSEQLNGIKVAQLYNQTESNKKKFKTLSIEYRTLNMKSIQAYALMQPAMNLMNAAVLGSALFWGGRESLQNSLAIGAVVTFVLNSRDMIPPIRELLEKYQMFQNSLTSAERIFALFDEPVEIRSRDHLSTFQDLKKDIVVRNLSFRYATNLPNVLKNLNLVIKNGSSLALVGRTGSGKSTLISLLQRFYEAPHETIWIGEMALEDINRQFLRSRIGVIQQDPFIFKGTIHSNISLGDPTLSEQVILNAATEVGFLDYLKFSNRTLQEAVDEKGANLSLGERQVISFIRMMVRNPDILILDEATANIDSMTEVLIQKATKKILQGRTSLAVAHRLSTIQECDQIGVLQAGELIELDTHSELMKKNGIYAQLACEGSNVITIKTSDTGIAVP